LDMPDRKALAKTTEKIVRSGHPLIDD